MSKLLVLTSEPITAEQLRGAAGDLEDAEVMVVAPAYQESPLKFWVSDADEAISRAKQVQRETLEGLGDEPSGASADTGESDPLQAIQDALITFPAERIVLFRRAEADERRYREDVDPDEVRERFGLPVQTAEI